jgi:hypothetical protein
MEPPEAENRFSLASFSLLALLACLSACGGGGGSPGSVRGHQVVRVAVSPKSTAVIPGHTKTFNATVLHAQDSEVTWSVNGENGGNAAIGKISSAGVYSAPETVPSPDTVTIRATSRQDSSKTASATVKILTVCSAGDVALASATQAFAFPEPESDRKGPVGTEASARAPGADQAIEPQTQTYDCSFNAPGDMLTLASGTRGPLAIRDCKGTSTNPITIRNDPNGVGPTVISRASGPSGGFILSCNDCVGIVIDGSYKWQGAPGGATYGIKVTMTGGDGPSAFLRIGGKSRFVTIRSVEVDGAWPALASDGSGIRINDHTVKRNEYPDLWREGILIEDNYIHNVKLSGMYIGPNYNDGDLPLRNVEIRNNRVEDTGFDGIQGKSMWEGDNSIHHNQVRRVGKGGESNVEDSQYSGIKNMGGRVKIYNNWIEGTGQHGIVSWTQQGPTIAEGRGPFDADIWNNVVVDAGALWQPFMSNSFGISIGAQAGCEKPIPHVYNNTIVNSRQSGIRLTSNVGEGFVRDNVVGGSSSNPAIEAPGFVELLNNFVGSNAQIGFEDPTNLNFHLGVTSPAWNLGSEDFPPTDFDDEARPRDGAPDPGAFEGSN